MDIISARASLPLRKQGVFVSTTTPSMSTSAVYLVSGSNRGIGFGFVTQILAKHHTAFIYAGARDPDKASALLDLKNKHPDRLAIVKLVSADVEGNAEVAKVIEARHGRVDTVIANAGIGNSMDLVSDVGPDVLNEHFKVNVTGTIVLFQAVYNLLRKSKNPRFVPVSTGAGCLDGRVIKLPIGGVAYGATKAALNWATRKIHFENDWLVAFPLSPGPVDTDMMRNNIDKDITGLLKKMVEMNPNIPAVDDAAALLLNLIDESTREKDGGEFVHIDGTRLPW